MFLFIILIKLNHTVVLTIIEKQKYDIIDSIIIADYLRVFGSEESKSPEENLLSLKQLTRFRSNIVDNVSSLKVQVIGLLDKVFPEYKKLFCNQLDHNEKHDKKTSFAS